MKLILLAAGKSSRIYNKIGINKCLINVNDKSLIENIIDGAIANNIKEIEVVTGFKKNNIVKKLSKYKNIKFLENKKYNSTDMVYSAMLAIKNSKTDLIISYTDIFYQVSLFKLMNRISKNQISIPFTKDWRRIWNLRKKNIYNDAETFYKDKKNHLLEIGNKITKKNIRKIHGQFLGIIFLPRKKIKSVQNLYRKNQNKKIQFTQFINQMIKANFLIKCINYKDFWYEIDDIKDLKNFRKIKNLF